MSKIAHKMHFCAFDGFEDIIAAKLEEEYSNHHFFRGERTFRLNCELAKFSDDALTA